MERDGFNKERFNGKKSVYSKKNNKDKTKEDSTDIYKRRNELIIKFFKLIDIPVRLVGNINRPAIIYNEEVVLNAYVHNFELRFTDSPFESKVIYTVKLDYPKFDKNMVLKCLSDYKARAIYKVYLKDTQPKLYLSGYNYLNKKEKLGRYPVFAAYNSIIHFTEDGVKESVKNLISDGYNVQYE
jgi:hypothetical protein